MKRNVRILLCGYYFQGNTGDDLMMESIKDSLSRYGEVRVTSTETFDADLIDWCQLLIIGAGSLITSRGIGGYNHAKYAKEKGKKVVYYALTIEDGHPLFIEHLSRADLITVRDAESKRVVESHSFRAVLSSDPIFKRGKRTIGFSFRRWVNEPAGIEETLTTVLDNLSTDYNLISLPYTSNDTDTESDTAFHEKIIQRMKNKPGYVSFSNMIEKVDLLIGMRLHALITAVNIGKKILAINYDAKIGRILSDLAIEDMIVSYDEINKIPLIVREKIFRADRLAQREKVNEALIARICADIRGEPSPKVSVVVPTYNRANYLREAIDSILAQTLSDWELILIDDGSTDDTAALVASYQDNRIRYYNFGHNGISYSRNIGNLLSRGEIIVVADSDDINLPNRLEITRNKIMESGADIFYSAMFHFSEDGQREMIHSHPFSKERLQQGNFIYHPTVAYRREVTMQCPYDEGLEMVEDYHLYLQAAEKGLKFYQLEEPLVMHRLHKEQVSAIKGKEMEVIHRKIVESSKKAIKGHDNSPMVSVIIPTYNRPEMLKDALMSVLSQTYNSFEIIVVNDAGKDVAEVIDSLNSEGKIIYLQHKDNRGLPAARNMGLKAARGKYIAYLDDDDIYYPDHLETLVSLLETEQNYKVAYTDSNYVFQERITDRYVTVSKKVLYSQDFDRQRLLVSNFIPVLNLMHRKDLIDRAGLFDEKLGAHEDWDMWLRFSQYSNFYHIKKITAEVRFRTDGTTITSKNRMPFLKTARIIHKRYSHFVTDEKIVESQNIVEWSLAKEVVTRAEKSVLENSYLIDIAEALIQQKDTHIENLAAAIRDKDAHLGNLEAATRDKDVHIGNLDAHARNLDAALNNIYNSHGWKVLLAYYRVRDKIFPHGTRRRRICKLGLKGFRVLVCGRNQRYQLILRGMQIISNEGWKSFWYKYKIRTQNKNYLSEFNDVDDKYKDWMIVNEPNVQDLVKQRQEASTLKYRPRISILTPVWNPDIRWLKSAIESVINQTYDNWELCLVDGCSKNTHIKKLLAKYSMEDPRIKVKFLSENKGIAGNSNEALYLATGEFIVLMDHDDELAPFALHEIVKILNDNNELDFMYSDEDIIDAKGQRREPSFKPGWSLDLFLSWMYTCHLGSYRKKLIEEIGGFRPGYEGSQDYDLLLRLIEKTDRIYHIPKVLYHWRTVPQSAAGRNTDAKPYAHIAGKKAINDYLHRNSIEAEVLDGETPGLYRVKRRINSNPLVSIIVLTRDNHIILQNCINSILQKTVYDNYEVIIVDNQSQESETIIYLNEIQKHDKISVLKYDKPFNFSAINNFAVSQSKGEHILLLNNDTEVINEDWLPAMLEHSQRTEVGAVGAKLLFPDNRIQHCGVIIGIAGVAGHAHYGSSYHMGRPSVIGNYSAVTAACFMLRKVVFNEIGGFDENLAVLYNDVDLCLRIRQRNYLIVYTPYATLYHYESATKIDTKPFDPYPRDTNYFKNKWDEVIKKGDPYYNPNLTLDRTDFSFKT